MISKPDLRSLSFEELKRETEEAGEKSFRATQVYEWLHKKNVADLNEMSNVPAAFKEKLLLKVEIFIINLSNKK